MPHHGAGERINTRILSQWERSLTVTKLLLTDTLKLTWGLATRYARRPAGLEKGEAPRQQRDCR